MRVLHVDTGREWRGGQRQVFFLHEGLLAEGVESMVAAQAGGSLFQRVSGRKIPLSGRGEWDMAAVYTLRTCLRKFSPAIAHAHDAHAHTLLLLASLGRPEIQVVVSRRVDFPIARSWWSRWKYRTPRVKKIITVSQAIKEVLIRDGIPDEKMAVVHSGIELKNIDREKDPSLRRALSIPEGARIIGCIANFAAHKDHRMLLRVFQTLAGQRKDLYLVLVGDGPLYKDIRVESQLLPCSDRIIFTGHQEHIYPYLLHLDVFVLTSYLEGLCTSLIDSLWCGIPIVASRTGGIPEVVRDGQNGFLAEVGDVSGFVAGILKLLDEPLTYKAFHNNCLLSAHQFSIKNTIGRTLGIYHHVINEYHGAGSAGGCRTSYSPLG